jgi:hypothetical protein
MNGFARRTAARAAAAVALLSVGCTASHAYKPTAAPPTVEGVVTKVDSKDSLSAAGGAVVAVGATHPEHSSGVAPASPGPHGAQPIVAGHCACGDNGCCGGCGRGGLHQKLRDCDWEQLRTDHCWPEQYNYESRRRVNQPLHDQIAAGHATVNTLHDFHFETKADSRSILNDAGKARLSYLARRKPYVVPSVFIQTTFDQALDAERMRHVNDFLVSIAVETTDWQLAMVHTTPTGLYGQEGVYSISKMIGPRQGANVPTPYYERILKNNFFLGQGGGQDFGGGGGS